MKVNLVEERRSCRKNSTLLALCICRLILITFAFNSRSALPVTPKSSLLGWRRAKRERGSHLVINMEKNYDEGNFITRAISSLFGSSRSKQPANSSLMGAEKSPILKDLVLVGGGHSHVFTLKSFGMNPMEHVQLTLISRDVMTPYSGMIPGYISGHYTYEECHIDLCKLARFAGARLIHGEVMHIDTENKLIHLKDGRPPLPYDVASVDVGSSPKLLASHGRHAAAAAAAAPAGREGRRGAPVPPRVAPVKPIDGFAARWDAIVARVLAKDPQAPLDLVVVGGGAGGLELLLAMQFRLGTLLRAGGRDPGEVRYKLVNRGARLLAQHNDGVRRIFGRILEERGVEVLHGKEVVDSEDGPEGGVLVCADGARVAYGECVWCTAAAAQPWLRGTALALDAEGFIEVEDTLESVNSPDLFACGDCAHVLKHPRPKAGVFAVRQGPPLTANLRRRLRGEPLLPFAPQRTFLGLISTGDKYAVSSKGNVASEGAGLWTWKDQIDRSFMDSYSSALPDMNGAAMGGMAQANAVAAAMGETGLEAVQQAKMRCRGCGGKVGASTLSQVLDGLRGQESSSKNNNLIAGIDSPDDAAIIKIPGNNKQVMVQTVDFLGGFITDPYLFGQVAALHALSDLHAMGGAARPAAALATALAPYALPAKVASALEQLLAGARKVLDEHGAQLAGGHTHEAAELALGLTITGFADPGRLLRKGPPRAGHRLVLTKPLGTGALFAAEMRARCRGAWYLGALRSLLRSNRAAGEAFLEAGASACTDVTGFGLLGHLGEMLDAAPAPAAGVGVELELGALPYMEGALECHHDLGITSSLYPSNLRQHQRRLTNPQVPGFERLMPLLFDPQTCGGLLAAVPAEKADALVQRLREHYPEAAVVGTVTSGGNGGVTLV